ncbi:MAG: thiamine pyrophosphate-binding protein [Rhodocyclaceae bacterium]|nr:thiamine pyrophosphate-binding protein [Rhodocyclaceae bacterium]
MSFSIAQALVRFAERLGIRRCYGMPGAHILPVYDALHGSTIAAILAKHEQGAGFMALGEARATGSPAACLVTAGPGATNLITPLASAYADRIPLLALCGETSTTLFGRGGLQEASGEGGAIDLLQLLAPVTRYAKRIERADYLPQVFQQAALALRGAEAGPVALIVPFNVQREAAPEQVFARFSLPTQPLCAPPEDRLREIIAQLEHARAPLILAGAGCHDPRAADALAALSHRLSIPVATTLKAKGVIDETDPFALGCLGVTSDGEARRWLENADLLLLLGTGFTERTSYLWEPRLLAGKRLIQIDRDARQIGRNFVPDIALAADLGAALPRLLELLAPAQTPRPAPKRRAIHAPAHFAVIADFFAHLRTLPSSQTFDDNIILAQSYLRASPSHRYFPNTGISALGHAIPAAIGARLACAQPTFAVLGDGGFQMCGFELMTAINHRAPLNVLLINNGSLGLIRKNQCQHYQGRLIACDFTNPDFRRLASAFGFRHHRLAAVSDVAALFAEADLAEGYNLIEIPWDKNVFPHYRVER